MRGVALFAIFALAGCDLIWGPRVIEGKPCGPGAECPTGFECVASAGTCTAVVLGAECTSSDDCPDESAPVCSPNHVCVQGICDNNVQCQATDSGSVAPCDTSSACAPNEKCVVATGGDAHCVVTQGVDDPPCSEANADFVEVVGTDRDTGAINVHFCADLAVTCTLGVCSGGSFS